MANTSVNTGSIGGTAVSPAAVATTVLAAACALLFWRWQALDQTPPKFDESSYLLSGLIEYKALLEGTVRGFVQAYLTVDPGRGGLPGLLTLPGFFLFGPSADAAIAIFFVFWPLVLWALYDAAKSIGLALLGLPVRTASWCGFFAALLFTIYPTTQALSNTFLVEFPLISFVLLAYAAGLRYFRSGHWGWALLFGGAVLGCVLAKVTAPAFLVGPALPMLWRWATRLSARDVSIGLVLVVMPSLLLAAPSYVINWQAVVETTRFLSSASMAAVYGLGGAWDPIGALRFVWERLACYEFLLCTLGLVGALRYGFRNKSPYRLLFAAMIGAGFLLPFAIVALSNFKDERYAYPGFSCMFLAGGVGLGLFAARRTVFSRALVAVSLGLPLINLAVSHAVLPEWATIPVVNHVLPLPDRRDWHVDDIVQEAEALTTVGPIYQLGGTPAFQAALFNFASRVHGPGRDWTGFPFQLYPNLTAADIERHAENAARDGALLYKSPPYEPKFLGRFAADVIDAMQAKGFRKVDLKSTQPDGSRFTLLLPSSSKVEILSRAPSMSPASGLVIGDRYAVTSVTFGSFDDQLIAELRMRRIGPPLADETFFFHLMSGHDIVGQLDRAVCSGCANAATVTEWIERFPIPDRPLTQFGFGIYAPPKAPSLKITGGATDWDGLRALVEIPTRAKP